MQWIEAIKALFGQKTKPLSESQFLLNKLDETKITAAVYSDIAYMEVLSPNIEEYCKLLNLVSHAIHGDVLFPRQTYVLVSIKRCHFWKNAKGGFTKPEYYYGQFKETCTAIIKQLDSLETKKSVPPVIEENLLRCRGILQNMKEVIRRL